MLYTATEGGADASCTIQWNGHTTVCSRHAGQKQCNGIHASCWRNPEVSQDDQWVTQLEHKIFRGKISLYFATKCKCRAAKPTFSGLLCTPLHIDADPQVALPVELLGEVPKEKGLPNLPCCTIRTYSCGLAASFTCGPSLYCSP